jgi:hypothetical protein
MKKLQHRGFTPDSRYCFFKTPEGYRIVRTFDNSDVCTLPKHIKVLVNADGGSYTLEKLVDTRRRKVYPWSTQNLLHLCPGTITLTK